MKLQTPSIAVAAALAAVLVVIAWLWSRSDQPSTAALNGRHDERAAAQTEPLPTVLPAVEERASVPLPTEPSDAPIDASESTEPRLLVRVLDEKEQGIGGAWVRWESGQTSGELETDAEGLAWVARSELADQVARVRAGAAGFYPTEASVDLAWLPKSKALEIRLPMPTRIEGVVLDADTRNPVGGAAIGFSTNLAPWLHPTEWTRSDAQGHFSFDSAPAHTKIVLTTATPEYAPTRVVTLAHQSPVEMLLERGEVISVRVIDLESGQAIAGARFADADPDKQGDLDGIVHARGLRELGEPFIELEVGAPHYCPVRFTYVPGSAEPLEVPLLRSASVVGQVTDSTGLPVEGASVTIESRSLGLGGCHVSTLRLGASGVQLLDGFPDEWRIGSEDPSCSTRTDGDGRFRINGLMPISFQASAVVKAPGFVTADQPIGTLGPPGGSMEVRVELARGGKISGVLQLNGEPVPGRITWKAGSWGFVEADMEGFFTLSGIPEGRVMLQGTPRKYKNSASLFPESLAIDLAAGEVRESVVLDLSLEYDTIAGRVLDPHGAAIQDVAVLALSPPLWDAYEDTTDEEGRFTLEVPAKPGSFIVSARHAKEEQIVEGIPPGTGDLVIRLGASGQLRVRARVLGTSESLPAFDIAWRRAGQGDYETTFAHTKPRDGEGFVSVDLPAVPADLVLVDRDQKYAPRYLFDVLIPEGGELAIDEQVNEATAVVFLLEGQVAHQSMALWLFEEHMADDLAEIDLSSDGYGHLKWLPEFAGRRLVFDTDGYATVRGVGPGRFRILCQGTSMRVDPEWIDVMTGDAAPVVLRMSGG